MKTWTFQSAIEQLEACGFECEAGPLSLNTAFQWLKTAAEENERLRVAIKPFADHGSMWPTPEDNLTVVAHLHVNSRYEAHFGTEDFRRAAAALSSKD